MASWPFDPFDLSRRSRPAGPVRTSSVAAGTPPQASSPRARRRYDPERRELA